MKFIKSSLLLMLLTLFVACDTDDDNGDIMQEQFNVADVQALQSVADSGSWRVTRFIEDNEDITSFFEGFSFTFNDDGTLVIENDSLTLNGTWRIEYDDDDDDDYDDLEFEISISTSLNDFDELFDELTDDWYVINYSDNRIQLADDDDDNGDDDDDRLTLERI